MPRVVRFPVLEAALRLPIVALATAAYMHDRRIEIAGNNTESETVDISRKYVEVGEKL